MVKNKNKKKNNNVLNGMFFVCVFGTFHIYITKNDLINH
jgi:hypothetical protein